MDAGQWLKDNRSKFPDREELIKNCMKATGRSRDRVVKVLKMTGTVQQTTKTSGRTLDTFRQVFDIPLRIRQGIVKHLKDCYMSDNEFRDAVGVHPSQWRRYADSDEFKSFRGRFGGQSLWASKSMMYKMRHIAGIPQEI